MERGRECDGASRGVAIRAFGTCGAIVSRFSSTMAALPNTVASGWTSSTALPHFAQNRAVAGSWWPQDMQNMGVGFYHPCRQGTNSSLRSGDPLDLDRGAVRQYFRYSLHDFIRVIPHGQNAICPMFRRVLQQQFIRFLSSLFA
jgi:hypothetical protein